MRYFKKLVGDRIYLSPRNSEDVEIFTEWLNDFETTDYIGRSSAIVSLEGEKKYLEEHSFVEAGFVIVTLEEDKMIGIFIGDKYFRSKGYGTEAIKLILEYGFKYLNLKNIKLDVMEFNERALKCYKKCGFKEYGRRRQSKFVDGKYYDSIEMDILNEEFNESVIRNKNI